MPFLRSAPDCSWCFRFLSWFVMILMCVFYIHFTVTAVDSGIKALEFLGLQSDDEHLNKDLPPFTLNHYHQVSCIKLCLTTRVNWFFFCLKDLIFWLGLLIFFVFYYVIAGRGESNYHWLFHAWNDWLWSSKKDQGIYVTERHTSRDHVLGEWTFKN